DCWAEDNNIPKIDLVKIDIEGGEIYALRGMKRIIETNPKIVLFIEYCPENIKLAGFTNDDFLRELNSLGLKIFAINQNGPNEIKNIPQLGNFMGDRGFLNLYCSKNDKPN
ncbi:MAG: FkbM family methyltransferase, partial [Patescibacteria group bacterium]